VSKDTGRRSWKPPSTLPPLYAGWIDDLLDGPLPHEGEATCEDCAMWPSAQTPGASPLAFHSETKCCTYIPALPNFLVGRIVEDNDPALAPGRASVEARIDARLGVTPMGIDRPVVHALLYQIGVGAAFGRSRTLRCPHYREDAGGACGIWRHRNGVCSTWFCKYSRGATGQRFWHGLEQLLAIVERELTRWCLLRLDLEPAVLAHLLPRGTDRSSGVSPPLDGATLDGRVVEAAYRAAWGEWLGREREFYRECARLVNALRWTDVVRVGGASVEALARVVAQAHHGLGSTAVPERLVVGQLQTMSGGRDRVLVTTYNPYDPLELPRLLIDVLGYFDGRSTRETLARIRQERNINVQPSLVRRLVDFGVLVAVDESTPSRQS
jgi:hypothetical protein